MVGNPPRLCLRFRVKVTPVRFLLTSLKMEWKRNLKKMRLSTSRLRAPTTLTKSSLSLMLSRSIRISSTIKERRSEATSLFRLITLTSVTRTLV